jgi:phosphoribosylanthranilate isomerase
MIQIKANGITNLTDARYFAAKGVKWLSFNFDEAASDYLNPSVAKAIIEWVEGVEIIGMWDSLSVQEALEWSKLLNINVIQIAEIRGLTRKLSQLTLIQTLQFSTFGNLAALRAHIQQSPYMDIFELELDTHWQPELFELASEFKIIFKTNLQIADLEHFIKTVEPYALTLCGGEEERIGVKSFDELDAIFDVVDEIT